MHLVFPTHPYFFWVAYHLNRIFPLEELEQKPQNWFFSSPHRQSMPFITFDPWPTISYIGWVQAGGAWVLRVLHLLRLLLMHLPWSGDWSIRSAVHFWLLMAWAISQSTILYDLLLLGVGPCRIMGLPSPDLLYIHFVALLAFPTIPLCYSYCNVVWLNPAGPLWACCLFSSQWLSVFIGPFLTLFVGSCPISLLGVFGLFAFLGLPWPFSNLAFPWAFTNSLGLPWLNYFISYPWG